MSGLIEGLPDDIALQCLARVPLSHYRNLKLVCHSWRIAIHSPELLMARHEIGSSEFLCISIGIDVEEKLWQLYDPRMDIWFTLPDLLREHKNPQQFGFVSTAGKLFVLGGLALYKNRSTETEEGVMTTSNVWSYDLILGRRSWDQRASMLVPRSGFAYCVLEGKIIVAGGFNISSEIIRNAEIYDPERDVWDPLPDLPYQVCRECSALVINGKVHVLCEDISTVVVLEEDEECGCGWAWVVKDYGWLEGPTGVIGGQELYVCDNGLIWKQDKEDGKIRKMMAEVPADSSYYKLSCYFETLGLGDELWMVGETNIDVITVGTETPILRRLPRLWNDGDGQHEICRCALVRI